MKFKASFTFILLANLLTPRGRTGQRGVEGRITMMNHYERERFAQTHRQDLLCEAEHERLLELLLRPNRRFPHIPLRLKLSWQALRLRLHQGV